MVLVQGATYSVFCTQMFLLLFFCCFFLFFVFCLFFFFFFFFFLLFFVVVFLFVCLLLFFCFIYFFFFFFCFFFFFFFLLFFDKSINASTSWFISGLLPTEAKVFSLWGRHTASTNPASNVSDSRKTMSIQQVTTPIEGFEFSRGQWSRTKYCQLS